MEKQKPSQRPCLREIISSVVFIAFIGVFFVLNFIIPAPAVLVSERRVPAKFPEFSMTTVSSGTFMGKFDNYASDRFVFRDIFRGLNSFVIFNIYQQTDKSGLYRSSNVGIGEFRRTNATAFRQTTERIKRAAESLSDYDMNIYYSVVPDMSTFAERYMPGFDLTTAETVLLDMLGEYEYIRVADQLWAGAFYKTDLHWDQSQIYATANHILSSMGADHAPGGHTEVTAGEFRGVYAGQIALPVDADIMNYIEVAGLKVSYLSEKTLQFEDGPAYDTERFAGVDPYDLFLRGPQPLIVIENASAPDRELYLFRDSFGSSLAPILACSYSKITVIDLRYLNLMLLPQFIEFRQGADVLFIYSSQIFNNPSILQA